MNELLTISVYAIFSGLLVWAAFEDLRTRLVPYAAGYGLLLVAIADMLARGYWPEALFFVIAILGTRGGLAMAVAIVSGIVLYEVRGEQVAPLLVGLFVTYNLFRLRWIGGGDAQVAFALIALANDWAMLWILSAGTFLTWVLLSFVRSPLNALRRMKVVFQNRNRPPEEDEDAIRGPWVVIGALAGMTYFLIQMLAGALQPPAA